MRYKLSPGIIVKSENAAKPAVQSSRFLVELIGDLAPVAASFDYGCGKLRYKDPILNNTDTLTLVDSDIQLTREQIICGRLTSVRDCARRSNRLQAYSVSEFAAGPQVYDRAYCLNVLSVIPIYSARRQALKLIRARLRKNGTCLFAVQYRNSDFTRMRRMRNARPWRDGFLIDSLRGFSFYGLITPDRLSTMVENAGFEIVSRTLNEGSVYLIARNPTGPEPFLFDLSEKEYYHAARH